MKVLLVGNYVADQQFSMQGFANVLLSHLNTRGVEVRLVAPQPVAGKFLASRPGHSGLRKWLGYMDKFAFFPRELRRVQKWADVVHLCDQGNAPYVRYLQRVPHIVTCNDLLAIRSALGEFPDWPTGATGRIYQRIILSGLNRAKNVVCISEATRQDVGRISRVPQDHVSVIYDGLFYPYRPMSKSQSAALLDQLGLVMQQPFLLHVGGNQPYKNRLAVLKIFASLRRNTRMEKLRLVMGGKPFTNEMRQYVEEQGLEDAVLELTGLDNEHLRALYSQAQALLFPSLYEGFGLPIIEAQACGCPVFTSNRAPMTEVGGRAAVYFDPTQPEEAAQVITNQWDSRDGMVESGFENIQRFTTERMMENYLQVYERVLS